MKRSREPLLPSTCFVAGLLATLLILDAVPSAAQLATITFPDTPVGSTATVKCPTNSVSLCFGANCSSSGTVQSVSGPNQPFKITKFNLLTLSQFNAGACEANPTGLPVTVGANQALAFQATFSPTAVGTFSGSATFSTPGGPGTFNFTGRGISSHSGRTDKGLIALELSTESVVPGNSLDIQYRTKRGSLQGNVDLYFIVAFPSGPLLFVTEQGGVTTTIQPFRRNVSVADATQPLFSGPVPVDIAFGTYTFYMVMVYAGMTPDPGNLPPSLASGIAQATVAYTSLSAAQQTLLASRGNPDFLSVFWFDELNQKRESWLYLSAPPTEVVFVNGNQETQETVSGLTGGPGPKANPALFTPQTTQSQLTAAFGPPTSVTPVDGAPEFQVIRYGIGLTVILRNGRFSSVSTPTP